MHYEIIKDEIGNIFGIHKKNSGDPTDESLVITDEELIQSLLDNNAQTVSLIYYDNISSSVKPRLSNMAEPNKMTIVADGADLFILSGLPIGCQITITDLDIETEDIIATVEEDGEIGFPTSIPGTYRVIAELFPYITKTWEVTAV